MTKGHYRTANGSEVEVSGQHSGIYRIAFDWVEEEGACIECRPSVHDGSLVWNCDYHDGGSAELKKAEEEPCKTIKLKS